MCKCNICTQLCHSEQLNGPHGGILCVINRLKNITILGIRGVEI